MTLATAASFPDYFKDAAIAYRRERDKVRPLPTLTPRQLAARDHLRELKGNFAKLKSGFAIAIEGYGKQLGIHIARGELTEAEISDAFMIEAGTYGIFAKESEKVLRTRLLRGLQVGIHVPASEVDAGVPPESDDGDEDPATDPATALAEMNASYATLSMGGKFRVARFVPHPMYPLQLAPEFSNRTDFCSFVQTPKILASEKTRDDGEQRVKKSRGAWWLEQSDRRQFDGIDFVPGGPEVIDTRDRKNRRTVRRINLYSGFSVVPKEGKCDLYLKHVFDHICGGEQVVNDYVLAWMASGVQQPSNPERTALSLRGKSGAGKGVFATEYGKIFGRHFIHLTKPKHVTGEFNAHTAQACMIFADEAMFSGNPRDADMIKTMISERTKMLEFKGLDAVAVGSYERFIFSTNHDHPLRIDHHDRRFLALHVVLPAHLANDPDARKRDYFGPLLTEMNEGGRAALLHYLMQYNIRGFNSENIPQTEELIRQKLLSAPPGDQFVIALAQEGCLPGALPSNPKMARAHLDNFRGGLFDHMKKHGGRSFEYSTDNGLAEILRRWGFEKRKLHNGNAWEAPDLPALRDRVKETYPGVKWPNEILQWEFPTTE